MKIEPRKLRKIEDEEWHELSFAKGRYEISNYGRIKSYQYDKKNGIVLKLSDVNRFNRVDITLKDGTRKSFYVHKLVAEIFLKKPSAKCKQVIHLDFNTKNNHVSNLQWSTDEDAFQRIGKRNSERNREFKIVTNSKLKKKDVIAIKEMIKRGTTQALIAKMFCISEMQITRIKRGENWGDIKID
jgi:hypothetical protein